MTNKSKQQNNYNNSWGAGIYEITNLITGKNYVGGTTQLRRRKSEHFSKYNKKEYKECSNKLLQADMHQYTEDCFFFKILEVLPKDRKLIRLKEKHWIDTLKPSYNFNKPK